MDDGHSELGRRMLGGLDKFARMLEGKPSVDYSYTAATGKRPSLDPDTRAWRWYISASGQFDHEPDVVPAAIYVRMDYQSHHEVYADALAAADAAYLRAVADGAMAPLEAK